MLTKTRAENRFRTLTDAETEAVSGGTFGEIVVIAPQFNWTIFQLGFIGTGFGGFGSFEAGLSPISSAPSLDFGISFDFNFEIQGSVEKALDLLDDRSSHVVDTSNLTNPSAADKAAIGELRSEIRALDAKISRLADNATVTVNGTITTGAQIKEIWSRTDFVINPTGTPYANGTTNGQADFNRGNPIASFNLNTVSGFANLENGLNFLVLHEFSHFLPSAQAILNQTGGGQGFELFTNDTARTLGNLLDASTSFPNGDPAPGFTIPNTTTNPIAPANLNFDFLNLPITFPTFSFP